MNIWLLQLCTVIYFSLPVHNTGCGRPNDIYDRIVHGRDVGYMKYPWFATLTLISSNDRLMCGGSLIGARHVLTAAHCFKPFLKSIDSGKIKIEDVYHVKLGVNNICVQETTQQIFSTANVYIHEKYREYMPYYDIALLELDREANFTSICLPKTSYNDSTRSEDGFIVGLGKESSSAWRLPCTVKEARVLVYNTTVCKDMLENMKEDPSKFENAFCAGYLEGGIDTCQGDSGGPLQTMNAESGLYELDGVTSFGFGCAAKGVLGVYTDVSHYINWIKGKITPSTTSSFENLFKEQDHNESYPIEEDQSASNNLGVQNELESTTMTTTTVAPSTAQITHHRRRRVHRRHRLSDLINL